MKRLNHVFDDAMYHDAKHNEAMAPIHVPIQKVRAWNFVLSPLHFCVRDTVRSSSCKSCRREDERTGQETREEAHEEHIGGEERRLVRGERRHQT